MYHDVYGRLEANFVELVLSFHLYMNSMGQTQVIRLQQQAPLSTGAILVTLNYQFPDLVFFFFYDVTRCEISTYLFLLLVSVPLPIVPQQFFY